MKKPFLTVFILSLAGLLFVACAPATQIVVVSSPTPRPTHAPVTLAPTATAWAFELQPTSTLEATWTPAPTTAFVEEVAYGPDEFPPNINPLTGLAVPDSTLFERRPLVIKISNFPRNVRPQWGLTRADHIYEYYLEDGLTRFAGIFYGQDAERVGPVRSARLFDEHIVRMYKGIFAFGYADDQVYARFAETDLKNFLVVERNDNCPPMCRIGNNGYNNMFTGTIELSKYITARGTDNSRQNLDGLRFRTTITSSGKPGTRIVIRYSQSSHHLWDYDPGSHRYLRQQETATAANGAPEQFAPLTDSLTGMQVWADNLVVLLVNHDYFYKSSTTEIYEMRFTGQGLAYAFRDGEVYPLFWSRGLATSLVQLFHADGKPFSLKPGNVFYEVLGETSRVEGLPEGWRFVFDIP